MTTIEPPLGRRRAFKPTEPLDHLVERPSWDCMICEEPWPCVTAQDRLVEEFRTFPSVLTIYMTAQMYDALGDLVSSGRMVPGDLFERFLTWTRRAAVHPATAERFDLDTLPSIAPKQAMTR